MKLILDPNIVFEQTYTMCHICLIITLAGDNNIQSMVTRINYIHNSCERVIYEQKDTLLDFTQS
jgi:hypothetical protein